MFFSAILALSILAADTKDVAQHLQSVSVTIQTGQGSGSGVIVSRKDSKNNTVNFVWTAGHVVDSLKTTREIVAPDGSKRTLVEFKDAKIVKDLIEDGRTIGRLELDAEVIRFSDATTGEDLALLKVRKKNYVTDNAVFYLDKDKDGNSKIPALGTQLYHVGSLLGQGGSNSMTTGIYSQVGRLIAEVANKQAVFDQTTVSAFPGSSGGGVFLIDGRYVGMLVRGAGETFNLIVPVRRMEDWAKKSKCEWALNEKLPLPTEDDIKKAPIEDTGLDFLKKLMTSPVKHKFLFNYNSEVK